MLTRCAACSTTFRITTEQLVLRQGKVRCGTCGEVFNALQSLVRSDAADALDPAAHADASPPPLTSHLTTPESATAHLTLSAPASSVISGATLPALEEARATEPPPAAVHALAVIEPAPARPFAWWSLAGSMIALLGLAVQTGYFYRNEAAARVPEAKPWLEQMCQFAGCRIEPPRDAQAISIESSDLQTDPANRNSLTLIALLRNRAGFSQDTPHLELTLTDAQDALVARRVLAPRDYFANAQIAAGSELPLRLLIDAGQLKASGYRLYAFYP